MWRGQGCHRYTAPFPWEAIGHEQGMYSGKDALDEELNAQPAQKSPFYP